MSNFPQQIIVFLKSIHLYIPYVSKQSTYYTVNAHCVYVPKQR